MDASNDKIMWNTAWESLSKRDEAESIINPSLNP